MYPTTNKVYSPKHRCAEDRIKSKVIHRLTMACPILTFRDLSYHLPLSLLPLPATLYCLLILGTKTCSKHPAFSMPDPLTGTLSSRQQHGSLIQVCLNDHSTKSPPSLILPVSFGFIFLHSTDHHLSHHLSSSTRRNAPEESKDFGCLLYLQYLEWCLAYSRYH